MASLGEHSLLIRTCSLSGFLEHPDLVDKFTLNQGRQSFLTQNVRPHPFPAVPSLMRLSR